MSELIAIKEAVDSLNTAFSAFKATNDLRLTALQKGDTSRASELEAKLSRIETDVAKFANLKDVLERLEELESRAKMPGRAGDSERKTRPDNPEYTKAFDSWIRKRGNSPQDEATMAEISRKDVTIGSSAGGGYAVPKEIAREVEKFELKFSPVRRLVRVERVGTSDFHFLLNLRGTTSGWVGETGSRSPSNTPQLRDVVPTWGGTIRLPTSQPVGIRRHLFRRGCLACRKYRGRVRISGRCCCLVGERYEQADRDDQYCACHDR